jgi:hypothetical protein
MTCKHICVSSIVSVGQPGGALWQRPRCLLRTIYRDRHYANDWPCMQRCMLGTAAVDDWVRPAAIEWVGGEGVPPIECERLSCGRLPRRDELRIRRPISVEVTTNERQQ